jgi:hypothetical protein
VGEPVPPRTRARPQAPVVMLEVVAPALAMVVAVVMVTKGCPELMADMSMSMPLAGLPSACE